MYDSHIHSCYSSDGHSSLGDICSAAVDKGLRGIAVCDHANIRSFAKHNPYERMKNCIAELSTMKTKYAGKLEVFQGIEIGEYLDDVQKVYSLLALTDYDIVLSSVHYVTFEEWTNVTSSRICFDDSVSNAKVKAFVSAYFHDMKKMTQQADFDVLTHLTYIFRYVNGKYRRGLDPMDYLQDIRGIFEIIIHREIALEVNTSELGTAYNLLMPTTDFIGVYRDMGGKLITLGSDAHRHERIGNEFERTKSILRELGFKTYNYYRERKCMEVGLE